MESGLHTIDLMSEVPAQLTPRRRARFTSFPRLLARAITGKSGRKQRKPPNQSYRALPSAGDVISDARRFRMPRHYAPGSGAVAEVLVVLRVLLSLGELTPRPRVDPPRPPHAGLACFYNGWERRAIERFERQLRRSASGSGRLRASFILF